MRASRVARAAFRARRALARAATEIATLACAALVPLGGYAGVFEPTHGLAHLAAALALASLLVARLASYLASGGMRAPGAAGQRSLPGATPTREELRRDVELGAILVVAGFAIVQATGGPSSLAHPLVFALVAFLASFHRTAVALPLVALAALLEAGLFVAAGDPVGHAGELAARLAFIAFFAVVHGLFVQGEMLRQRRAHRMILAAELTRAREEARDFRLIASSLGAESRTRPRAEEEEKLLQGAVETIHQALFYNLELLKKSLELHTCVLLWLDERGERLRIKELVTDADCVAEGPFSVEAGAVGGVVKALAPVHLVDPKPGHLPYYAGPVSVGEVLAVPVLEDGHLRGVLCADRLAATAASASGRVIGVGIAEPTTRLDGNVAAAAAASTTRGFDDRDTALLVGAARQMLRVVQAERIFGAVERAKYEHERFYSASSLLNRALTPEQVFETAFAAAREIVDFDFAAVTSYDKDAGKHRVAATSGDAAGDVAGLTFSDGASLVAMVVKNRHFLPAGGELRDKEIPLFTKKTKLKGMESLLVLPLIAADEAIGTFALASGKAHFFGKDKREMLGVIANQVAVSLENAEMYRRVEEMATTDGLTGLVNHRSFQERFADLIGRAERQQGRLALLLTDVDFFKKVNDTYGHPTGDQVLKRVASVCKEKVRKIDVAARYGGEEFAIVLDGTDLAGARGLAERIRTEIEKVQMTSDKGPFHVTLSLGIAAFPDDGRDAKALIHHADQALYEAKHGGRNRAVAWADVGAKKLKAV